MKFVKEIILVAVLGLAIIAAAPAITAQTTSDDAVDVLQLVDYLDYESVSNPQISPDGKTILYTRNSIDKVKDRRKSSLWMMDSDGGRNRQLMSGGSGYWSPEGTRIAFVKADDNSNPQIYVRFMDGEGLTTQVTDFEHAPRAISWSPDGSQLAFVARVPLKDKWSVQLPGRPKGATWTEDPVVIDTLHYRQDRVGFTNSGFDHIFLVPAIGGTPRQLTDGEWNVGKRGLGVIAGAPRLEWSPNGKTIAFDGPGKPIEPGLWFESHINLVNVMNGQMTALTPGTGSYGDPAFSPDGKKIAFAGYPEHNTSYPVSKLYVIDADGSDLRILAEDLPDGPTGLRWAPNSREIYFAMDDQGSRNLHAINMRGRKSAVTEGEQVVTLGSVANTGALAMTFSRSDMPVAVAVSRSASDADTLSPLTNVNADLLFGKTLGRVEEIWYDATAETGESARVQGWVVYPPNFDETKTYPLMLSIHGGPHAMYNNGFNFTFQEFAARGYIVLYTNPRGSTGYGSEFANAIRHRYPGPIDYADLIAGVDTVLEQGFVDPERMFVTGCSGGGILTTWVIGQTNRFKAAAALCPVVNWIGMSGTTDVVGWLYNFFPEPFWENPEPWLAHSTIMHVGKVETPTLLMTGTRDLRTPLGEAEEYFAALKVRGIPARLVPMIDEYHGTRSIPSNYLRTSLMMRKWFDEFDPGNGDADTREPGIEP